MFWRFFCLGVVFFALSCGGPGAVKIVDAPSSDQGAGEEAESPPIKRAQPKEPDPKKQANCAKASKGACEGSENCEDVCDDIFSRRRDKQDCYELPETLVFDFEELLESAEDGDVDSIDSGVLECLLDIDETEFARAVKKMSRREAKDFLFAVSEDDSLAEVLEDEDDEFNILKQLLNKATGSNKLNRQLREEIEDDKGFIWLAGEGSEFVWDWLDNYVGDVCDGSNSGDVCPGGDNIGAYCKVLLEFKDRDLEDFLSDADFFADEFEEEVEDEEYLYEVDNSPGSRYKGDFKDYCQMVIEGGACPADGTEPPSGERLAEITFEYGTGLDAAHQATRFYVTANLCHGNGWVRQERGSADPSAQNIILALDDYDLPGEGFGGLAIDKDQLDPGSSANSNKTWYLYLDDQRYTLSLEADKINEYTESDTKVPDAGSCARAGNDQRDVFEFLKFLPGRLSKASYNVYLASKEDGGDCEYHKP